MGEGLGWGPAADLVPAAERARVAASFAHALTGTTVKATASGCVQRVLLGNLPCHLKFYFYRTWRARWSGALRTTWLCPGRVAREWSALGRLAAAGMQPDLRVAWGERRTLGFLTEAFLLTQTVAAPDLASWARAAGPARLTDLLPALHSWIAALHRTGHRDRNLDPRNLLVVADGAAVRFVKIDSPRSFQVRPGDRDDRWRAADLARLRTGLAALRSGSPGAG